MSLRLPPVCSTFPVLLHGGDYNPDQWLDTPEVLAEDLRLMQLSHSNAMSVGIFAWAALEPEEGRFEFGWLDQIMDNLYRNGQRVILATPSGAKPNWMAAKYPEIRRVAPNGIRELQQTRHNHCYTSPVYREKVTLMNTKLAERYAKHPALIMWHISNEYGGECHCNHCIEAFREFLKNKYQTLAALNKAWWANFWSHTFTDWNQIQAIDSTVHGQQLDWKRFVTHQTTDFVKHEAAPLRTYTPQIPITINMMGTYTGLNYPEMAPHIDVVSWDSYPNWGNNPQDEIDIAAYTAFIHDLNRSMKDKPFILMESTPSVTNWQQVSALKRPNLHRTASLQAVAHGADSVLYFQWRKSRGSSEKFHGAVVDHVGNEHTRVFRDVASIGADLAKLSDQVPGTITPAQVGIVYDWENRWVIDCAYGPRNKDKRYEETVVEHHRAFWNRNIPCDVFDSLHDFSKYRVLVIPMLYMLRPGVAERLKEFVRNGGTLVATYLTGTADSSDLVYLGGLPGGGLMDLFGIWAEEVDALVDSTTQQIEFKLGNSLGLTGSFACRHLAEIVHLKGAHALASYTKDFYAGSPAVTVNHYGKGKAYYLASRLDSAFTQSFIDALIHDNNIQPALKSKLPAGVSAMYRTDGTQDVVFIMNFTHDEQTLNLDKTKYIDALKGTPAMESITLQPLGTAVVLRPHES